MKVMRIPGRVASLLVSVLSLHCAGCSSEPSVDVAVEQDAVVDVGVPCSPEYATDLPEGPVVYVASCYAGSDSDGSVERPFASISAALAVAETGSVVAVAAGMYEENVAIVSPVHLVGAGKEFCTIATSGKAVTMIINQVTGVTLRGFSLTGNGPAGLYIAEAGKVTASDLAFAGYAGDDPADGSVVMISQSQTVELHGLAIAATLVHGVTVSESSEVTVSGCTIDGGGTGVFVSQSSDVTVQGNSVRTSVGGGIGVQMTSTDVLVANNDIAETQATGIAVSFGSSAVLTGNTIVDVGVGEVYDFETSGTLPLAFGVLLRGDSLAVELSDNVVIGCALAGVLVSGEAGTEIEFGEGNVVAGNEEAGIALEGGGEVLAEAQDLEQIVSFVYAPEQMEGNGPTGQENVVQGTAYLP